MTIPMKQLDVLNPTAHEEEAVLSNICCRIPISEKKDLVDELYADEIADLRQQLTKAQSWANTWKSTAYMAVDVAKGLLKQLDECQTMLREALDMLEKHRQHN